MCMVPVACRAFSILRGSFSEGDDVDLDSVAYGYMASQALFTALELEIFDNVAAAGQSGLGVTDLGKAIGISAPRLKTLLTSLVAIRCLKIDAEGRYCCSENTARFMVSSSKHYYGDYLKMQIGRQFYHQMAHLPKVMKSGEAPDYATWFSDPEVARMYTAAQHNGSVATAKGFLKKQKLDGATKMLDVGGGSGAFSYVFVGRTPGLESTVLELPGVCQTAEQIRDQQPEDVRSRVKFVEMDASKPDWPVDEATFDVVLMSYISGSVPEPIIEKLYANAFKAMQPGGRLFVHDFIVDDNLSAAAVKFVEMDASKPDWPVDEATFDVVLMSYISGSVPEPIIEKLYANAFKAMQPGGRLFVHDFIVDDNLTGPALAALWALQHVTVNAQGLGLSPSNIISRMESAGFNPAKCETFEMIHGLTKLVVGYKD
eukprot:CAMPEP_0172933058 /NCGR_PEP_ID=MMETSP1075-20121228/220313_1 /TAXON_ID=2916 /ORGANISM="Ceratium fusus, Strain PA161109" /LENGTH=428 /DNA_ID=CAMNT_0013794395 /DNA_START=116 /DNA_END=1401 /DNA_ORIENTATION=-